MQLVKLAFAATTLFANSALGADHQVMVGAGGLTYTPSELVAAVNDTVTFVFASSGHTVSQTSFANPCTELADGFDSNFQQANAPSWTIQILTTDPIWYYCKQATHCSNGMVGSINAPTSGNNTFSAYQAASRATTGGAAQSASSRASGVGVAAVTSGAAPSAGGSASSTAAAGGSSAAAGSGSAPAASGSATSKAASGSAPAASSTAKSPYSAAGTETAPIVGMLFAGLLALLA
ncbi:hypothetical protein T439DRAFT_346233 [Meredithblackwellia eburnea MCA 4105]